MFTFIFEAFEAPYFHRQTLLQFPGRRRTVDEAAFVPEKFVAEENANYCKDMSANEGINADSKTVKTSNLPMPP